MLSLRTQDLTLIPVGIALNIVFGTLVSIFKLPIYMDAVGTILVTILSGLIPGIITGVLGFVINGFLSNPVLFWFVGTQTAIALAVYLLGSYGGYLTTVKTVVSGILLGIIAGIVSAPVIVYLFGGITGSGSSLIVAYLIAGGEKILNSVILSGLACEPLDKTIQLITAIFLIKAMPESFKQKFSNKLMIKNGFLKK